MKEIITEKEFDSLPEQTQMNYRFCTKCRMFYSDTNKHHCLRSRLYRYTLEIIASYPHGEDEKTDEEMARDCGEMICDEIARAGGVGSYFKIANRRR